MRGSSLGPLLPPFWRGSGMSSWFSHFLPASLYPVSPKTMSSYARTASADGIEGWGPSAQTPPAGQQPSGWMGSGPGQYLRWGSLKLWYCGIRYYSCVQWRLEQVNTQSPIIFLKCLLMVTLNHSWFQNYYCKCLSEKCTITCWFHHKMVELSMQEMQTIISSSVIQLYVIFYHPNSIKCLHSTKSCVVVSVAYLTKLCIHMYYYGRIVIWKHQGSKS